MLAWIVIVLIAAAVVVYIVRSVKPKRVKVRAGVLKILTFDFEADGGSQPGQPADLSGHGNDPKELPSSEDKGGAALPGW